MISSLQGFVEDRNGNLITLNVGGVGYEVLCSADCLLMLSEQEEVKVVIYTDVKEDSINLYGFADRMERQAFILLTKVKGVGSRSASDIISRINKLELLRAIGAGDVALLQSVKGVGKKTAERIVVELKDKVAEFALERTDATFQVEKSVIGPFEDAIKALIALGFAKKDAEKAVGRVDSGSLPQGVDSGHIVKEALRFV